MARGYMSYVTGLWAQRPRHLGVVVVQGMGQTQEETLNFLRIRDDLHVGRPPKSWEETEMDTETKDRGKKVNKKSKGDWSILQVPYRNQC